ncbi:MAG: uncharacterized protein JWM34_5137 [Ilumatobacteraceae bacterium]|nr:uncharacterized protein [Ilumatobacteraceae bacterium]
MRLAALLLVGAITGAACSSTSTSSPSTAAVTTVAPTTVVTSTAPAATDATAEPATTEPAPTTEPPTTDAPTTTEPATTEPAATDAPTTSSTVAEPPDPTRPYTVFVPTTYDAGTPEPLVLLLHGYSASGDLQEGYFQLQAQAESRGFLYVHPDGTKNALGNQFWNATDACCGFGVSQVDDSAYLIDIIHQVEADYNVDRKRVYLVGHSNGGFMSYRMACDHADEIAAIVSLAGATWEDTTKCTPSEPVSVLEVHGTGDHTIAYDGGQNLGHTFPSAPTTVATWATYDGCTPTPVDGTDTLDLVSSIDGNETTEQSFAGCPPGIDVNLWTMAGAPHIPPLTANFAPDIIDFLFAHPKP